jgi:hypothetical protein
MKRILIFQENTSVLEVYDADESELSGYTKNLSQILENANVTIFGTSTSSIIIRPSKIISILIQPIEDPPVVEDLSKAQLKKETSKKKSKKAKEEHEDIITDAD